MHTILFGELEQVGDLVDLPLNGEGNNVAGTQLLVRQVKTQIPGGQPVPYSIACSEPVVNSWKLQRLFSPGEERGLKAEHALKWGHIGTIYLREFWTYSAKGRKRL